MRQFQPLLPLSNRLTSWLGQCPTLLRHGLWIATWTVIGGWASQILAPAPHLLPRLDRATAPQDARWMQLFSLPESHVEIGLRGLVAAGDHGMALLSVDHAPPRAVHVGQDVAPGVRLQRVDRQGVTLLRSSGLETLTLTPPAEVRGANLVTPRIH